MNPIPVLGIEEIAFEVQDIEQSVAFYRDIVGLELLSRGPQQAWFRVGAQRLALFTRDRAGSGQHFAFRIPADMAEQVRNAIVSAGFPEETMEQDDGLSVYVRDPDGNILTRHRDRANVGFCDGHVESPTLKFLFEDDTDGALVRWNLDHRPRR